jgi:hypothetical protein
MRAYLDWRGCWKDGQKCGRYQQATWILPAHKLMYKLIKVICGCKRFKTERWWKIAFRPINENRGLNWLQVQYHRPKQKTFLSAQQYNLLPYVLDLLTAHILTFDTGPLATFTRAKGMCSVLVFDVGSCTQSCGTCQLNTPFQMNSEILVTRATKIRSCYTRCHSVPKTGYRGCFRGLNYRHRRAWSEEG